jgi:hypothetical protein
MPLTIYDASVSVFGPTLGILSTVLDKGEAFAAEHKIDSATLLAWRLAPDMYPLTRQVQLASDFAKGTCARLAGAEVPSYVDDEKTFDELRQRIAKTRDFLATLRREDFAGAEERDVTLNAGGTPLKFKGQAYLLGFGIPNFFFHVTTAYDILRACGVPLSKRDFLAI